MNDRLLFRVYDLVNHCYLPTENGLYFKIEDKRSVRSVTWFVGRKEYRIEQCTGLRDEEGKLIYENDRVNSYIQHLDGSEEELSGRIAFDGIAYVVKVDGTDREELLYNFFLGDLTAHDIVVNDNTGFKNVDFFVQNNLNGGV